jgi:predicted nucleic acid-binding protein
MSLRYALEAAVNGTTGPYATHVLRARSHLSAPASVRATTNAGDSHAAEAAAPCAARGTFLVLPLLGENRDLTVDEPDSGLAESFLRSEPRLLTARHTIVEVRRNLAWLLGGRELAAARSAFAEDLEVLLIVELDEVTCEGAAAVAEIRGVRTLDAMHLSAAQRVGGPTCRSLPSTFDRHRQRGPSASRSSAPEATVGLSRLTK